MAVWARSAVRVVWPKATWMVREGGTRRGMTRFPWCASYTPGGTTTGTTAFPCASATTGPNVCEPMSTLIRPRGRVLTTASPSAHSGIASHATSPPAAAVKIATCGIASSGGTYCASQMPSRARCRPSIVPTLAAIAGFASACTRTAARASLPSLINEGSTESARARRAAPVTVPSSSSGWRSP